MRNLLTRTRNHVPGLYSVPVLLCALAGVLDGAQKPVWLITPAEAARLSSDTKSGTKELSLEEKEKDGPIIEVVKPKDSKVSSPVDIDVLFRQRAAPPDLSTLECKIRKRNGWLSKDVTDVVRAYLRGNEIRWPGAKVPEGDFELTLRVKDNEKRVTVAIVALNVMASR